tara:strand:- start:55 stop:552 length:498 start_codon:yes stop_codon:yes gene_type:complete
MDKGKQNVVLDWIRKIHVLEHAHRLESIYWKNTNFYLGIPALIISAIIAPITALNETSNSLIIISTVAGVIVAILVGLQTFLKPGEIAEQHRQSSNTFEKLRHKFEFIYEFETDEKKLDKEVNKLRETWGEIDQMNISQTNFKKASEWINDSKKYPEEFSLNKDE